MYNFGTYINNKNFLFKDVFNSYNDLSVFIMQKIRVLDNWKNYNYTIYNFALSELYDFYKNYYCAFTSRQIFIKKFLYRFIQEFPRYYNILKGDLSPSNINTIGNFDFSGQQATYLNKELEKNDNNFSAPKTWNDYKFKQLTGKELKDFLLNSSSQGIEEFINEFSDTFVYNEEPEETPDPQYQDLIKFLFKMNDHIYKIDQKINILNKKIDEIDENEKKQAKIIKNLTISQTKQNKIISVLKSSIEDNKDYIKILKEYDNNAPEKFNTLLDYFYGVSISKGIKTYPYATEPAYYIAPLFFVMSQCFRSFFNPRELIAESGIFVYTIAGDQQLTFSIRVDKLGCELHDPNVPDIDNPNISESHVCEIRYELVNINDDGSYPDNSLITSVGISRTKHNIFGIDEVHINPRWDGLTKNYLIRAYTKVYDDTGNLPWVKIDVENESIILTTKRYI